MSGWLADTRATPFIVIRPASSLPSILSASADGVILFLNQEPIPSKSKKADEAWTGAADIIIMAIISLIISAFFIRFFIVMARFYPSLRSGLLFDVSDATSEAKLIKNRVFTRYLKYTIFPSIGQYPLVVVYLTR